MNLSATPDMAPHSGKQPSQGAAHIQVVSGRKREGAQPAHSDVSLLVQRKDKSVGAFDICHEAILGSRRASVNIWGQDNPFALVIPAQLAPAKADSGNPHPPSSGFLPPQE